MWESFSLSRVSLISTSTDSSYVWVRLILSEVVRQSAHARAGILLMSHRWGSVAPKDQTFIRENRYPIFGVLLSFHLQHTTTADIAARGMTTSPLVIDSLTVEQWWCTCFRLNLIHGTQVTPSFTTTLVGVSGIFRPFPFATFAGRVATST